MTLAPALLVLVCGSVDRGDDGAATRAIEAVLPGLAPEARSRVDVRRCGQLDPTDLIDVQDGGACLVLDTVVGVEPGRVVELSLDGLAHAGAIAARSSHALPIQHVLGIAEGVRGALPRGAFVGIGGERFGFGDPPSPAVARGRVAFERAAAGAIGRLLAPPGA